MRRTHDEPKPGQILDNPASNLTTYNNKQNHALRNLSVCMTGGDIPIGIETTLRTVRSGDRVPLGGGEIFLTRPYTTGTGSILEVKRPAAWCWPHTQPLQAPSYTPALLLCLRKQVTGPPLPCTFNKVSNSSSNAEFDNIIQSDARNVIPFYHTIKTVTS